jgi:hypothetical protein
MLGAFLAINLPMPVVLNGGQWRMLQYWLSLTSMMVAEFRDQ